MLRFVRRPASIATAVAIALLVAATAAPAAAQEGADDEKAPDYDRAFAEGIAALDGDRPDDAIAALERCRELDSERPEAFYHLARAHGLRGDARAATQAIAWAIQRGFLDFSAIEAEPDLAAVREDESFREMVATARTTIANGVWGAFLDTDLHFTLVPEERHDDVVELARLFEAMEPWEPTPEELERIWAEQAPEGMPMPPQAAEELTALARRARFLEKHADAVEAVRQLAAGGLYDALVERGDIDPKTRVCLVAVPFPCPNTATFDRAASFIDAACAAAQKRGARVVIVRAPYGRTENIARAEERNWWWAQIASLPKRYDAFIATGTAEITDAFPGGTSTPYGFIFRERTLVAEGNMAIWARDPDAILSRHFPEEAK